MKQKLAAIFFLMILALGTFSYATDEVSVTLKMNTVSKNMYLTNASGEVVDVGDATNNIYSFSVAPGKYVVNAFQIDQETSGEISNGTIGINITEEAEQTFQIWTVTAYCSTSGWQYNVDYIFDNLSVVSKNNETRENISIGTLATNIARKTFLVQNGDTYRFNFMPIGERTEEFATVSQTGTVSRNATKSVAALNIYNLQLTIPYKDSNQDTINDYELEFGTLTSYYIYNYLEPVSVSISGDKEIYDFKATKNINYFYRVNDKSNSDAVTYGNYVKLDADASYEVTEELMHIGMADYDKDTIVADLSVNSYDVADIYLNINEKGYLSLEKNDTYTLYPLRNWLPIEGSSNAKVIEPDFHYEIIEIEGENVLSIEECLDDTSAKHSAEIKANSEGTAIVIVTYDALINGVGWNASTSKDNTFFSAIWPENSGVFVVTVGEENEIDANFLINEGKNTVTTKLAGDNIDSEHDVLYYLGGDGAKYSFPAEEGTTISILRPNIVDDKLTYSNIFSTDGIEIQNDVVTISNLIEGSNIVKLEKNNSVDYQIIRAKKLNYEITCTRSEDEIEAKDLAIGDVVTIIFDTVYHPANKMSGYYNNTAQIVYTDELGNQIKGTANQYLFASTEAAQTITFSIPEGISGDTYTLKDGSLLTGGYGSAFGAHRSTTYEKGKPADFTAVRNISYLSLLPDIELSLKEVLSDTNSGDIGSGDTSSGDNESGDVGSGDSESGDVGSGDNESGGTETEDKPSTPETSTKIKVYFRLIGATLSTNDVDLSKGEEGYYGSKYETWLKNKSYKIEEGSTAKDLIVLVLNNADIFAEGIDDNYITMIEASAEKGGYTLSAMENGDYSGWMYTVNGEHPYYGINDMVLKNNDKVVLHYVNDYRYEIESFGYDVGDEFYNAWLNTNDETSSGTSSSKKQDEEDEKAEEEVTAIDSKKLKMLLLSSNNIFGKILRELYNENVENMILDISSKMQDDVSNPDVGSIGGEWLILGLARANINVDDKYYEKYYNNLVKNLKENDGVLNERKYTEYSRVILALTAIGKNPADVAGYDLLAKLNDYNNVVKQGINGPIFALLALDSANYSVANENIRILYVEYILSKQQDDGGFLLNSNGKSDVDTTAMAIQALAKYKDNENVNVAINKALNFLSNSQTDEGGFMSSNTENLESSAQVLVALNMLGIEINDSRFVKNGNTILDNMFKYYVKGKGVKHTLDAKTVNQMASEQALYALVSFKRASEGMNSLYDMSDANAEVIIYNAKIIDALNGFIQKIKIK